MAVIVTDIVKILNIYIMLLCTHLYHFFLVSIHYLQCIHCLLHYITYFTEPNQAKINIYQLAGNLMFMSAEEVENCIKSPKLIYKLMNGKTNSHEWVCLNFNQILTSRQTSFMATRNHRKKVGLNTLANRVFILNNRIPLNWFNKSFNTF